MTTRSGMVDLVTQLRLLTDTVTDVTDTLNYWSDDELQAALDRSVKKVTRQQLTPNPNVLPGNMLSFIDYYWPSSLGSWVERATSDLDSRFTIQDSTGAQVFYGSGSNQYMTTPEQHLVMFGSDQGSHLFYMTAYFYDLNEAAASVWLIKASKRTGFVDWKTDNHSVSMSQEYDHCMERVEYFKSLVKRNYTTRFVRVDQNGSDINKYRSITTNARHRR